MDRPLSSGEELPDDTLLPPIETEAALFKDDQKDAQSRAELSVPYEIIKAGTETDANKPEALNQFETPEVAEVREQIAKAAEVDQPIEGELEKSHEIKHFDVPNEPPPITAMPIGTILQGRQQQMVSPSMKNLKPINSKEKNEASRNPINLQFSGIYRQAIIYGFIGGLAIVVILLLINFFD